jgi:hypothetical protein
MAVVVVAGLPGLAGLVGLIGLAGGCAETSPSGVVVAPVAAASGAATAGATAGDASPGGDAIPGDGGSDGSPRSDATPASHAAAATAPARFRGCAADADCVAVPRVGCCHNGWFEAVAVSQKDAYAASFVCPVAHPICAMGMVRDTRQPACESATHLCTLH